MSAMRQSDAYTGNWQAIYSDDLQQNLKDQYVVNELDRINALTDSTKKSPAKMKKKQQLLRNLLSSRRVIIHAAEQLSAAYNTDLTSTLERVIPSTASSISKSSNDVLASSVAALFDPLQIFMMKYKEQQQADATTRPTTRGSATSEDPLYIQQINEVLGVMKEVDDYVVKNNVGGLIEQFKPMKLTPVQRARTFDIQRQQILDVAYWCCIFCLHHSVNSVPENDTVVAQNKAMMETYNAANKVWTDYKAKVDAEKKKRAPRTVPFPKHPISGDAMKGAPKKPNLLELVLMCMCKTSQCIMQGSDIGSSCFTQCLDVGTNVRCTWDPMTGRCTCPICQCQCPAAWSQNQTNKIGLGIMKLHKNGHLTSGSSGDGGIKGLQNFLTQVVNGGVLAGAEAAKAAAVNSIASSTAEQDALVEASVMEATASMICRNGASLPASSRQLMQKEFGQSTEVTLPGGQTINTTMLGSGRMNLHTNNNHLRASQSTNNMYLPGMANHQEPDFTTVTDSFIEASQQPTVANSFLSPFIMSATGGGGAIVPAPAAAASAAAATASTASFTPSTTAPSAATAQIEWDRQFALHLETSQSGYNPVARAAAAATPAQSHVNPYAAMHNGGGKMGSHPQHGIIDLVDDTPPSHVDRQPSTSVSHLTIGTATQMKGGGRMDAASALLPSFNASSSSRNIEERKAAREINSMVTLETLITYNNSQLHTHKKKSELSTPEKKDRKVAKRRKKKVLGPLELEENSKKVTAAMRPLPGPGEATLSQTPCKASPETLLTRLEEMCDSDSDSD